MATKRPTPAAMDAHATNAEVALSYIPPLLANLADDSDDGLELSSMFAAVLQAMRDGGYEDGFRDAQQEAARKAARS
jgi:hypothetical protein